MHILHAMPTLEITTVIGCPLMCDFCPQVTLRETYTDPVKYLSFANFQTIVAKIPKHVRIDFSGMAEPWINPECNKMLEHTLSSGYEVAVYTTLVGMTPSNTDVFIELLKAYPQQIKILCLHLPDEEGHLRGWKNSEVYQYALTQVLQLDPDMKKHIGFQVMTMHKTSQLHSDLSHLIIPELNKQWNGHTRAGSLSGKILNDIDPTPQHHLPVSCGSTPFYDHNVLLPNGDVVLCCMDYALKNIIGNLLTSSYEDLYLSPVMVSLMKENKKFGYSKCSICKSCTNAKSHNIARNHWNPR